MLIDSSHTKWALTTIGIAGAAVGIYSWLNHSTPGGLTGGSTTGLWYGVAGSALMIYAGLLAAHRKVPAWWWIGSRAVWLKGHIWLGLLSAVLILCHSGFRWGGPLEMALWATFALTLATGTYGLALQHIIPRVLTGRIPCETPYHALPHVCDVMRRKAEALVKSIGTVNVKESILLSQVGLGAKLKLIEFHDKNIRPYLVAGSHGSRLLANPRRSAAEFSRFRALPGLVDANERLKQLEALCDERRLMELQERLHRWLHGWLLVHVPISGALLVLGVAHAVGSLYF
jgi:hypothetical protein